jgi:hypothetical protein
VSPGVLVANVSLGSCEAELGAPGVVVVAVAGELIRDGLPVCSIVEGAAILNSGIAADGTMGKFAGLAFIGILGFNEFI